MHHLLLGAVVAVVLAVLAAGATTRPGGAAVRADSPASAAKPCPNGYVHAIIERAHHCLRRGQRCAPRLDRVYRRYGFRCPKVRKARLVGGPRIKPKPKPKPKPTPLPRVAFCGGRAGPPPARYDHVVVIWFENKNYTDVVGNRADAPYFNALAGSCGLATNYWSPAHISRRAYIASTSGEIRPPIGVPTTVDKGFSATGPSIFGLTSSWKVYVESMQTNCQARGTEADPYEHGHNPAIFYGAVADLCKRLDVPAGTPKAGALADDLRNGTLPAYSVLVPDKCNSMHHLCGAKDIHGMVHRGDAWLKAWMQAITASSAYRQQRTAIFVTWDEGKVTTNPSNLQEDCLKTLGPTCHVATVVVTPYIKARRDGAFYTHFSLLKTTEELLGLTPLLGHAADPSTLSMRRGLRF
jgi:hypothetical protein